MMTEEQKQRDRVNRTIDHLKINWTAYKLETYPWGKNRVDEGRMGREDAIVNELKHKGLVDKDAKRSNINLEDLINKTRALLDK